jgi:hypothetical protein
MNNSGSRSGSAGGLRPGRQARWMLFLLLIACLACVGMPLAAAQPDARAPDYAALAAEVDRLERRLERLREAVDQTRFDPDELVFELAFDAGAIVAFVREEIAFHPYDGLLRGMRGTLMTRAGNSLDQALLLAYLLRSAGLDARLVRGTLEESQVVSLLARTAPAETVADLSGLRVRIGELFGPEALPHPEPVRWAETEPGRSAGETVEMLRARLAEAGISLAERSLTAVLGDGPRPYFWVEHRSGPGEDWQAVHPVFAAGGGPDVEPEEYMSDRVGEEYQHKLTVEAWIRRREGDSFRNSRIMSPWTRPSANLHGVTVSYRNHAGSITPERLSDLESALDEDEILTPIFRGAPAPGAMAFDLRGRTVDPTAMGPGSFGAAGLFQELSNKMQAAAEGVDGREDGRPLLALDAMWLEFTLTTPSGRETRYRRYLLAPGAHGDSLPDKLWPLLSEHVYVINTGSMPLDYLAERYLVAGGDSLAVFKALAHKLLRPDEGTDLPPADVPQDFGPLALYRVMAVDPLSESAIAVRHVPSIVGVRNGLRGLDTAFSAVDVVENRMLQVRVDGPAPVHDAGAALRRGVWDTAVEAIPARLRGGDVDRINAFAVFERARQQDAGLTVLTPDDEPPGSLPAGVRTVLQHELDNGFAVLIPTRRPDGVNMTAWWRIDPIAGTTLGMTADGYGQSVVEYLIEVTGIAFGFVQALGGLIECEKEPDRVVRMCCLVEAHMNNVAGLGFGTMLGQVVRTAEVAVFDIVSFGLQQAGGKGLGPNFDLQCDQFAGSGF